MVAIAQLHGRPDNRNVIRVHPGESSIVEIVDVAGLGRLVGRRRLQRRAGRNRASDVASRRLLPVVMRASKPHHDRESLLGRRRGLAR
jgi:hypothetical protein